MSVDVAFSDGSALYFSNAGWSFLVEFARAYGWNPEGTSAPQGWDPSEEWPGHYDPAEGQAIRREDAKAMADGIDGGLASADRQTVSNRIAADMTRELQAAIHRSDAQIQPFNFTEKGVAHWREFVRLARDAGFMIS